MTRNMGSNRSTEQYGPVGQCTDRERMGESGTYTASGKEREWHVYRARVASSLVCRDCHRPPPLWARFGRQPLHPRPCAPPPRVSCICYFPTRGRPPLRPTSAPLGSAVLLLAALWTTSTSTGCATGWRDTSKLRSRQYGLRRLIVRYWHLIATGGEARDSLLLNLCSTSIS